MQHSARTASPERSAPKGNASNVLCVDLDGTLIHTDVLVESALVLLRSDPVKGLLMPVWLLRGKAHLKERLSEHVELDVSSLPYDTRVLELIGEYRKAGRRTVLATATHRKFAQQIADHLGVFDEVLSTDANANLAGVHKRETLIKRYGARGFDYVGNSRADLEVWKAAGKAFIANPEAGVVKAASRVADVAGILGSGSKWSAYLRLLRPHQWLKNLLIFVPMFLAHQISNIDLLMQMVLAFVAFGLTASSVYVVNDMLDLEADRHHVRKRHRPLAAGLVPIKHGLVLAPFLVLVALAIAIMLPWAFLVTLAGYYMLTVAYSLYLKRLVMLDVVTLAALYTVRILAGAAVMAQAPSFWLLALSLFMFLSLALVKRYSELIVMQEHGKAGAKGRGYQVSDLPMLSSLGAASGYIAVLVMALYINSPDVLKLYHRPELLWLSCPALLFWVGRVWILAHRGGVHDDPVVFALRDRWSQALGVFLFLVVLAAT